jgi:ferredoxin
MFHSELSSNSETCSTRQMSTPTNPRIVVNVDLCEANGACELVSATVFTFDDDDEMQINHEAAATAELSLLQEAIKRCPRGALKLTRTQNAE